MSFASIGHPTIRRIALAGVFGVAAAVFAPESRGQPLLSSAGSRFVAGGIAVAGKRDLHPAGDGVADSVVWIVLSSHDGDLGGKLLETLQPQMDSARAQGRTMFIEVGATWCGPCLKLEANLKKPEIIDAFAGAYIVHLDVDEWNAYDMDPLGFEGGVMPILVAIDPRKPHAVAQIQEAYDAKRIKEFVSAHRWPIIANETSDTSESRKKH